MTVCGIASLLLAKTVNERFLMFIRNDRCDDVFLTSKTGELTTACYVKREVDSR